MEERYWTYETTDAVPKSVDVPKTNETRIVDALESIASELLYIRQHLESITDGGGGFSCNAPAIRTTGR